MAVTALFARRATLARSLRLLSEFRFEQREPGQVLRCAGRPTPSRWSPTCGIPRRGQRRRTAHCSTSAAARVTSPRRSAEAGIHYIGVEPDPAEMHAGPVADDRTATYVRASGIGSAVRRRQRRHLPVVQRRRTRCGAVAAGPRDVARHQAGRPGGAVVHGVAGPVRRPRNGALALPRRCPRGADDMPASTAAHRRTTTARHCSRSRRPTAWTGPPAPVPCSPHSPATTRDGAGG